jgi:hypothetical protein
MSTLCPIKRKSDLHSEQEKKSILIFGNVLLPSLFPANTDMGVVGLHFSLKWIIIFVPHQTQILNNHVTSINVENFTQNNSFGGKELRNLLELLRNILLVNMEPSKLIEINMCWRF